MTSPESVPDGVVARTQQNLVWFHRCSLALGPGPRVREWPEATALGSDLPTEVVNTLFVNSAPADAPELLSRARAFFREAIAWRVTAPDSLRSSIESYAVAAGMRAAAPEPRMILAPLPRAPAAPAELAVRRVTTRAEWRDFCSVTARAFRIPEWYLRIAFARPLAGEAVPSGSIRPFVGYAGGRPVAAAAQATSDDVAGIFFVGTVPDMRRRGYGQALTWTAVEDGRSLGADAAWLQSSPEGRPLYEQMGFRRVVDDLSWVSRPAGAGQFRALLRLVGMLAIPSRRRRRAEP